MICNLDKKFVILEGSNGVGKTTVIQELSETYGVQIRKSVPEWFQIYITDVRKLPPEKEYKLYEMAHMAAILENTDDLVYIYDRGFYSTVIRIFYKCGKSVEDAFQFILNTEIHPELVLVLWCTKEQCCSRIFKRDGIENCDVQFFKYETQIYKLMILHMDNCYKIDASRDYKEVTREVYGYIRKMQYENFNADSE